MAGEVITVTSKANQLKILRKNLNDALNKMTVKELSAVRKAIVEYGLKTVLESVLIETVGAQLRKAIKDGESK